MDSGDGCERLLLWFGGMFVAVIVSAMAMPVLWAVVRVVGLIEPLMSLVGGYRGLMVGGGAVIGALIGGVLMVFALRSLGQHSATAIVFGVVGGVVGGIAGTLMFFPIVVFL